MPRVFRAVRGGHFTFTPAVTRRIEKLKEKGASFEEAVMIEADAHSAVAVRVLARLKGTAGAMASAEAKRKSRRELLGSAAIAYNELSSKKGKVCLKDIGGEISKDPRVLLPKPALLLKLQKLTLKAIRRKAQLLCSSANKANKARKGST